MPKQLENPSARFRTTVARGISPRVDGNRVDGSGGKFHAGVIYGFSAIARGEALGHGFWIDSTMVEATTSAINTTDHSSGAKSRFAHPDASGDAIGSTLGRCDNARTVGDKCFADLHFLETAHRTPDGDLSGYVLDLATEDPESFGASIAFTRDIAAEDEFGLNNGAEWKTDAWGDQYLDYSNFKSPDPGNTGNLPHARLAKLHAVDIVDDPAANPDGLFHSGKRAIPNEADAILSYALGRSTERPTLTALDIDPDRVSGFVTRFLARNNLELLEKKAPEMPSETTAPERTPEELAADQKKAKETAKAELLAEQKKYTDRFGAEKGLEHFSAGTGYVDALELHATSLEEQLAAQAGEIDELKESLAATKTGEEEALDVGADDDSENKTTGLASVMNKGRGEDN